MADCRGCWSALCGSWCGWHFDRDRLFGMDGDQNVPTLYWAWQLAAHCQKTFSRKDLQRFANPNCGIEWTDCGDYSYRNIISYMVPTCDRSSLLAPTSTLHLPTYIYLHIPTYTYIYIYIYTYCTHKQPDGPFSVPRFWINCIGALAKLIFFMSKWHQKKAHRRIGFATLTVFHAQKRCELKQPVFHLTSLSVVDPFWPTNLCCPSPNSNGHCGDTYKCQGSVWNHI